MSKNESSFRVRLSLKGDLPQKTKAKVGTSQNQTTNHVVTVSSTMSIYELQETAIQLFDIPKKSCGVELYVGFPPKLIAVGDMRDINGDKDNTSDGNLATAFIRSGDNVTVKVVPSNNRGKKRPLPTTADNPTSSDIIIRSRPSQRDAAKVASASFKEVIKEQDKILKGERITISSPNKNNKSRKKIATINNNSSSSQKSKVADAKAAAANSRRLAKLSGGRRLGDDNIDNDAEISISSSQTNSQTTNINKRSNTNAHIRKVPSLFKGIQSEDDISFALMSAVNANGSGRKVSKVLRSAMRRTVEKSYEASRAVVRCSAITSGDITFIPVSSTIGGEGTCNDLGTYTVRYPKGVEGNGYYEDENVHIISIEMLKAVIQSVYNSQETESETTNDDLDQLDASGREMLRPNHMAQLSPRVFWSLWFHFSQKCKSIHEALEFLLPDFDWKFVSRRSRQLSQKAKENMLQRQVSKDNEVAQHTNTDDYLESRINAVKSVEESMETMFESNNIESVRARAAEAAMRRFINNNNNSKNDIKPDWILETPTEMDVDELHECITEAMQSRKNILSSTQMEALTQHLISRCSIRNWRMLANTTVEDLLPQLTQIQALCNFDDQMISSIITFGQQRSLEEIMLEILDGNEDVYDILREDASSATPMDMTLWHQAPIILLEEARRLNSLEVTEGDIVGWCERAEVALNAYPWLKLYSTSIS